MHSFVKYLFLVILASAIAGTGFLWWHLEKSLPTISYHEFLADLDRQSLIAVEARGNRLTLTDKSGNRYKTLVPDLALIMPRLKEEGLLVTVAAERPPWINNLLTITLPLILLFFAWLFYQRKKEREARAEETSFAKDKKNLFVKGDKQVTFRDVAGIPEVKEELLEIIDFLQRPKEYSRLGATVPKGVLLIGPPGTGKTLLARAIAGEAKVPFFSISGSDFVEMFVGVGASRVRDLFREAKLHAPCIIFIDEIDAVGGRRGGSSTAGGPEERAQTLNALLVEMDGFGQEDNIIILAATNRPDILDSALLRPGRFDRQVTLLPPDIKGRLNILQVHTRKVKMAAEVNLEDLARSTSGFSGAQLANLVNEAALVAARSKKQAIDYQDFEAAKDRILMGAERKGMVVSENERRTMAFHEAGHAILANFLPGADPIRKITIVPRGRAMGHVQQISMDDRHAYSREYLKNRITILLGGRAAEEIALDQQTTGAKDDLRIANEIVNNMVYCWGMSEMMGPRIFARSEEELLEAQVLSSGYSEETARLIDHEIKRLLEESYVVAKDLLTRNKSLLYDLAEILLQTETLDRDDLQIVLECTRRKSNQEDKTACEID